MSKNDTSTILPTEDGSHGVTYSAPTSKKQNLGENDETPKPPSTDLGAEHELLKSTTGKWTVECSFFMGGEETKGVSTECIREMDMGGRFLRENLTMDFMGMPYRGEQIIGCSDGVFQSTYIDNMSNRIFFQKGKQLPKDKDSKVLAETELFSEPLKDWKSGRLKTTRHRYIFVSKDEIIQEAFETFLDENVERMDMRFVYRRA